MGLETGTYVSDLVITNPPTSDLVAQGDDHLRLIKTVLKNTFPNSTKAFYFPSTSSASGDFTVTAAQLNNTFLLDTTAGAITITLPTLASGDAGFTCTFIKIATSLNPVFLVPASGTLTSGSLSGLSKTRRCIPGVETDAVWTGSSWILTRAINSPVGSILEYAGTTLPVGFEWPNGQTLSSAANYPDYNTVRGGLTTPDRRGRVAAGKDDMGGSSANRLTNQTGGLNGDTFEAAGGGETQTLLQTHLPNVSLTTTIGSGQGSHTHTETIPQNVQQTAAGAGGFSQNPVGSTTGASTLPQMTGSTPTGGSDTPHNNVQPTIIENFLLVVE